MPLTQLMHYFNDQLQIQIQTHALPKSGFYKVDQQYWARFGSLILGSQFSEFKDQQKPEQFFGQSSDSLVRSSTGKVLSIDEIFKSLDNVEQIIHLDRLLRTLHSLNYLQTFDGQRGLLALKVQPRHIVSVTNDHGRTFEAILKDCGLGPERVLLHTHLLDQETLPHFRKALESYKSRGYLIGVRVENASEEKLLDELKLDVDVVFNRLSA